MRDEGEARGADNLTCTRVAGTLCVLCTRSQAVYKAVRYGVRPLHGTVQQLYHVVLVLCLLTHPTIVVSATDCDVTVRSSKSTRSGTFKSPNYPQQYDHDMRCIYRFIAGANEKVQLNFTRFEVKGVHQRCHDDYVDVYTQASDPDQNLLDVPLHGRYCGNGLDNLPHLLISMYHILILGFYTDAKDSETGFMGTYDFIDASIYTIGTPAAPSACGQKIYGDSLPIGTLLSPTYPGMYPDNIFCYYKLIGQPGQRIRFTFNDLDMYSGGEHCPYDYIKIYDGYTNEAEVIGTYCGKLKDLKGEFMPPDIYSTGEAMLIEFVTKSGRVEPTKQSYVPYWAISDDTEVKQRGFNATFQFSYNYVKLDFIMEGAHVRGTECDQRIMSGGETNGSIQTPNYPELYPPNITCKFYLDGLVDKENLEKTKLQFTSFDIPSDPKCKQAFVKAYTKGQDIQEKPKTFNHNMCGATVPAPLVTTNPRLLLVFRTAEQRGTGFRAAFQFVTDYAIPGTPATNGAKCHFHYQSYSVKGGTFNSPRNPSHYPPNTRCVYDFHGLPNEQVVILFESFELQINDTDCTHDYVELFMIREDKSGREHSILVGHYCGENVPGPMVTDDDVHKARVVFHSDGSKVSAGFKAKYEFIPKKSFGERCVHTYGHEPGGTIASTNFPLKYMINSTCEYIITTENPSSRVMLQFSTFAMEGTYSEEQHVFKCPNAVLKIYTNSSGKAQYELCASQNVKVENKIIISQGNSMKLKFISSTSATGGRGFKLSWTEVKSVTTGTGCDEFYCEINKFCISKTLRCNGIPNCGYGDTTDEPPKCDPSYTNHGVLHIILGVVLSLILLVFIIVCILHRRRKARKKKNKKEIEVRYVTRGTLNRRDGTGGSGPATDKLLKERTEKVSIV